MVERYRPSSLGMPATGIFALSRRNIVGHVRQGGGNCGVAEVAMDHAATVEIWVGTAPIGDDVSSAMASVCK